MNSAVKKFILPVYLSMKLSIIEKLRWRNTVRNDEYRVFYGHERIPAKNEFASGGIIKFQDLQEHFPNSPQNPNLLYILTSAMIPRSDIKLKYAKKNGAPVLINQNGVAFPGWHGPGWEKANKPLTFLVREADYVIYQSNFCKVASDQFLVKREHRFEILHNSVDTHLFIPIKRRNQDVKSQLKLLMAGSYHEIYRIKVVLHVLKHVRERFPDVHLTIAGRCAWRSDENTAIDELSGLAEELGVSKNMEFIGSYSQADAVKIYQGKHIFIHTTYLDPCPRVVVEALSCGLPVVYSASGGVPELVDDTAGIGIPSVLDWEKTHAPDPEIMADAVLKIVNSYDTYSKSARDHAVKKFDVRSWVKRHGEIFRDLVAGKI